MPKLNGLKFNEKINQENNIKFKQIFFSIFLITFLKILKNDNNLVEFLRIKIDRTLIFKIFIFHPYDFRYPANSKISNDGHFAAFAP
jgi:hypothetical protein